MHTFLSSWACLPPPQMSPPCGPLWLRRCLASVKHDKGKAKEEDEAVAVEGPVEDRGMKELARSGWVEEAKGGLWVWVWVWVGVVELIRVCLGCLVCVRASGLGTARRTPACCTRRFCRRPRTTSSSSCPCPRYYGRTDCPGPPSGTHRGIEG